MMMTLPTEQPLYVLPQVKKRPLIPKIFTYLFLGLVFYLGVLLNVSLLELSAEGETLTRLIALFLLLIITVLGITLSYKKANQKYFFYKNKIVFGHNQILLSTLNQVEIKRNFLDKLFKTYSLVLSENFKIENIPEEIQLQNYVQNLVNYARREL